METVGYIASELKLKTIQVEKTINLLSDGATIPFIARYRKEVTGNLDEVQIQQIDQLKQKLDEFFKRKDYILKNIEEQGKLTEELKERIEACWDENELEDLYLPYKSKRKTRADKAREQGLEPLAKMIMSQRNDSVFDRLHTFLNDEVADEDTALQGTRDIIAEWVNEHGYARNKVRFGFERSATIKSKVVKSKADEAQQFKDYFDFYETGEG